MTYPLFVVLAPFVRSSLLLVILVQRDCLETGIRPVASDVHHIARVEGAAARPAVARVLHVVLARHDHTRGPRVQQHADARRVRDPEYHQYHGRQEDPHEDHQVEAHGPPAHPRRRRRRSTRRSGRNNMLISATDAAVNSHIFDFMQKISP